MGETAGGGSCQDTGEVSKGEREGEKEEGNEEGGGGREGEVRYRGLCGINSHQLDCYV